MFRGKLFEWKSYWGKILAVKDPHKKITGRKFFFRKNSWAKIFCRKNFS